MEERSNEADEKVHEHRHQTEYKSHVHEPRHEPKTNTWHSISFVILIIIGIIILFQLSNIGNLLEQDVMGDDADDTIPAPQPVAPSAPAAAPTLDVSGLVDDDMAKGDNSAKITMVEFSDFECPFCGKFFSDSLPSIKANYIDTGKIKLVYRDFPLSFHPHAQKSAEAAECAKDQDKFWDMHDKIFENQQAIAVDNLKSYAEDLDLDTDKFNACLDSGEKTSETNKDMNDGQSAGISGTPGFIIFADKVDVKDVQNAVANLPANVQKNVEAFKTKTGAGARISGALPASVFGSIFDALA